MNRFDFVNEYLCALHHIEYINLILLISNKDKSNTNIKNFANSVCVW